MEKFFGREEIKSIESPEGQNGKYTMPSEEFLNPSGMISVAENIQKEKIEILQTNIAYQNMVGGVLQDHILSKNMSREEIDALATAMVEEYDKSSTGEEENQVAEIFEEIETENKEEVVKQKEENKPSIFTRAVEAMKEYLVKYPKVAKIAMVGMLAYEMGHNPAMADDSFGRIGYSGVEGTSRSAYAQQDGRERAQYNAMYGNQRTKLQYREDIQRAEQLRQIAYKRLDDEILRVKSSAKYTGTKKQEESIANQVYTIRLKIENMYRNNVANAQLRAQISQENTQMRQEEIELQTQQRLQRINIDTSTRIANQAINGIVRGVFGR